MNAPQRVSHGKSAGRPAGWLREYRGFVLVAAGVLAVGVAFAARSWFAGDGKGPRPDAPKINTAGPPGPAPEGMVWVPGGWFWMGDAMFDLGNESFQDAPPHLVY